MDLQNTFYLFAIVFMSVSFLFLIFVALTFFLLYRRVERLQSTIEAKINQLAAPAEIAVGVGTAVAQKAIRRVQKIISKKE